MVSEPISYGFGNIGRGSDGDDRQAMHDLRDAMPTERSVVLLCEINEGDSNDEMTLARNIFKDWHLYCEKTREPILLSPDWARAKAEVHWVANTAVRKWSPPRSINVVHLPGENISVIGGHPAAGAYHGTRPAAAKLLLVHSWNATNDEHRAVELELHRAGRDVVWLMDYNNLNLPPVVKGEQTVFHQQTDWGRVLPAPGRVAHFNALDPVPFHVDSHDGQRMRGGFHDKGAHAA